MLKGSISRTMVKPDRRKRTNRNSVEAASNSYRLGYERGYEQGIEKGKAAFGQPYHGTSIVIPSYNQVEYLIRCIESIESHTPEPHEIIVVDNGSTDGTGAYLDQRSGQLRFKRLDINRGFSGGVNQGLMMAKGDTIVILNNDTLVTPGWLGHMLQCLQSDAQVGAVGPVTNYISGEQQIDVPYANVEQMWEYAATRSKPDQKEWRPTDRLVGFCILFRRTLLERIGYFDEGFRIGNYEDDDWIIRARLCGLKLMIAGDAFIHHFGSVSMKTLGTEQFHEVDGYNERYFAGKWGNSHAWVEAVRQQGAGRWHEATSGNPASPAEFFPSHVLIRDQGGREFFLYHGAKHPCSGFGLAERTGLQSVTLSRMDILHIPTAENALRGEELLNFVLSMEKESADGQLVSDADGTVYQMSQGSIRPFVSDYALERWQMKGRSILKLPAEQLQLLPRGLPIIAPPVLENPVL